MDLFAVVQKLDAAGEHLASYALGRPVIGARGWFRVSHREIDEQRSTPYEPFLTHEKEAPLRPGEIVRVDIPIWPHGMFWRPGEQLRVIVADHSLGTYIEPFQYQTRNKGTHVIHAGGRYDSHLLIPFVPQDRNLRKEP